MMKRLKIVQKWPITAFVKRGLMRGLQFTKNQNEG